MMYNSCPPEQYSCHCKDSFMSLRGACDEAISTTKKTCHCEELCDEAIQTNHEQSTSRPLEQNSCRAKQYPCHSEFISESISFETEKSNLKEFTNKINKSCRAEFIWLLFPKSFDFVKNVWFSTAPIQRGISNPNVKKLSNKTNKSCHSEFISESISFETEKSNLKEFTNKTNRSCRPELVWLLFPKSFDFVKNVWFSTGPNKRSISSFNKITNKFYTLSVGKMLNILNQLKIPHFMLQHDMFTCHCEKKMTLQTNEFSPCHCEECNDEAISITQKTCHCEELCDEAIQSIQKQESRGVICQ